MMRLQIQTRPGEPFRLLCIGAHSDDLEIGCGSTILTWLTSMPAVEITWVVLSARAERSVEARNSVDALLQHVTRSRIVLGEFHDGFMPAQYREIKEFFEGLKQGYEPDIILTHWLQDRHQDHRLAAELTWNTWRNHLILEYEIAKYEGDLAQPNAYMPVSEHLARSKVMHLERHFASQRSKGWFLADNFYALMRLRGLECRAASGFAEAFHARKLVL